MNKEQTVRDVQIKILEIMKFIDTLCRENHIKYFIMGGTALGAVRHHGFIPWDDDLDIFMSPLEYEKFKNAFLNERSNKFVIQEWRTTQKYLEYSKVRMNGTTFIEECFKNNKEMHHGIYVDIMILHKVPLNKFVQKKVYFYSKFVTLYGLSQRNWKPKTKTQRLLLFILKLMPKKFFANIAYKNIYKYDKLDTNFMWCYWITPARFKNGLFSKSYFEEPVDIPFEDTLLLGSSHIEDYLSYRYGDYMKLPSPEKQKSAVHALVYDVNKDYTEYLD